MVFVGCTTAEEGVLLLHYYNIVHFIKISESFYPTRLNPSTRLFIKIKYLKFLLDFIIRIEMKD